MYFLSIQYVDILYVLLMFCNTHSWIFLIAIYQKCFILVIQCIFNMNSIWIQYEFHYVMYDLLKMFYFGTSMYIQYWFNMKFTMFCIRFLNILDLLKTFILVPQCTTYDSKFGSLLCDLNECLSSTYGDYFDLQRFNIRWV